MLSLSSVELINAEFILTKEGYALHPSSSREIKKEYVRCLKMQDKNGLMFGKIFIWLQRNPDFKEIETLKSRPISLRWLFTFGSLVFPRQRLIPVLDKNLMQFAHVFLRRA